MHCNVLPDTLLDINQVFWKNNVAVDDVTTIKQNT